MVINLSELLRLQAIRGRNRTIARTEAKQYHLVIHSLGRNRLQQVLDLLKLATPGPVCSLHGPYRPCPALCPLQTFEAHGGVAPATRGWGLPGLARSTSPPSPHYPVGPEAHRSSLLVPCPDGCASCMKGCQPCGKPARGTLLSG